MHARMHNRRAARAQCQRAHHQIADGRKNDGAVQFARRRVVPVPDPFCAQFARVLLMQWTARKNQNAFLPMSRDLQNNMRARAKPKQPDGFAARNFAQAQRAITDNARAQQRRDMFIRKIFGQRVRKIFINANKFRVTAVRVKSRKANVVAQIFAVGAEPFAIRINPIQPRHADARSDFKTRRIRPAHFDHADNLMPRHDWHLRRMNFALANVQIGVTHRARGNADANFIRARNRRFDFGQL